MAILYLTAGVPGVGKSTFIKNHIKENEVHISRDVIRFNILKDGDAYFSKENEVFAEFIKEINENINAGKTVFADATHIGIGSRRKLLSHLSCKPDEINIIYLKKPLNIIIEQNKNRYGTRSYVPEETIEKFYREQCAPSLDEGFDRIYTIEEGKPIKVLSERE